MSYAGMLYGFLIGGVSVFSYLKSDNHISAPWFLADILLLPVLFFMWRKHVASPRGTFRLHHIPAVVEVFRFGLFIIFLSIFLMLGTLGVHELGHSLLANAFGCTHETKFGIGFAVTHVMCDEDGGSSFIALGGFILTVLVAAVMFIAGNDFARRISFLLLAFSMLISIDDFTGMGMPYSLVVIIVFASMMLIGYGIVLVVKEYELEYEAEEAAVRGKSRGSVLSALR